MKTMERGAVNITGVTTRQNTNPDRVCAADGEPVETGAHYERVMRSDGSIESYHPGCFNQEFDRRELYGA